MITIQLDDRQLQDALARLRQRLADLTPVMQDIGEKLVARAKQRFASSTGPDGQRWAPNRTSTLAAYAARYAGSYKKDGSLSKRGQQRIAGKKPLIGESRQLSQRLYYQDGRDSVFIGSPQRYAGVQQFGAKKGAFGKTRRGAPIPWGDIPPRPFLPVTPPASGWAPPIGTPFWPSLPPRWRMPPAGEGGDGV